MKVVKGNFKNGSKDEDKPTTKDKILKSLEQLPILSESDEYDFALVVSDPEGYTTVATSVCIADAVFMMEACKLGLILNTSDDDTTVH